MSSAPTSADLHARRALLHAWQSGSWAEAGGIPAGDVQALVRVGASALLSRRASLACSVFQGLVALEPTVPAHRLHLAAARRAQGDDDGALSAIGDLLGLDGLDDGSAVHALLLRAEICGAHDRPLARADLARAQALAARSVEGQAAWIEST